MDEKVLLKDKKKCLLDIENNNNNNEIIKKKLEQVIDICNCLGRIYLNSDRYKEALVQICDELRFSIKSQNKTSEATARRGLGEYYSCIKDHNKAVEQHIKYLDLAQNINKVEKQRAFATIGRTHFLWAQDLKDDDCKDVLNKAKDYFFEAKRLCLELENDMKSSQTQKEKITQNELWEMRARVGLNLGLVFEALEDDKNSLICLKEAIDLNKKNGFKENLYRSQTSLASLYERRNDLKSARNAYTEALTTAQLLKKKVFICETHISLGKVEMRLENLELSRKHFKRAYLLRSALNGEYESPERLLKVCSVLIEDYKKWLKTDEPSNERIFYCDKIGDHFVELNCYELAIKFYKMQLNSATLLSKPEADMAQIYVSIAQTYADNEQFDEALNYFKQELFCYSNNNIEESKSLLKIAEMKENLKPLNMEDIISDYENALEKIQNEDNNLLVNVLERYFAFLQNNQSIDYKNKLLEIQERLASAQRQKTTECEMVCSQEDIYDNYCLDHLSDDSSNGGSDEEKSVRQTRRKPNQLKLLKERNIKGESLLHLACIEGNLDRVTFLLEMGHNVNCRDNCGWTPLHEAANHGFLEITRLLISKGANIDHRESDQTNGVTPLMDACSCGHFDIARLLLKSGANVTLVSDDNETALDALRMWRDRNDDLSSNDIQEYELLERELEEALKKAGFVKKQSVFNPNKRLNVRGIRNSINPYIPYGSQSPKKRSNHLSTRDSNERDFDDPIVAIDEYSSAISNLRRNKDPNNDIFGDKFAVKSKTVKIPALLTEEQIVGDNDWLERDINDSKKRSKSNETSKRVKRRKSIDYSENITNYKSKPLLKSDNESDDEMDVIYSDLDQINNSRTEMRSSDNEENESQKHTKRLSPKRPKSFTITVYVVERVGGCLVGNEDTFAIPIRDKDCNCLQFKDEIKKRYAEKFGVKPQLILKTTDTIAQIFDTDCILDIINDNLKVTAIIDGWELKPLDVRYQQICDSDQMEPIDDIVKALQSTEFDGRLVLTDVNIPVEHIKFIFGALQRQTNVKEINISSSNIIFDDMKSCFQSLSSLPNLEVLNLKCTAISLQNLKELKAESCPNLIEINLSFNTIGDYNSDEIIKLVNKFPKLNRIDLTACDLSDKLVQNQEFKDAVQKSNLRSIIFDFNTMSPELVHKFRTLKL